MRRLRDPARAAAIAAFYYRSGLTLEEIGNRFGGLNRARVRHLLAAAGEPLRKTPGRPPSDPGGKR